MPGKTCAPPLLIQVVALVGIALPLFVIKINNAVADKPAETFTVLTMKRQGPVPEEIRPNPKPAPIPPASRTQGVYSALA